MITVELDGERIRLVGGYTPGLGKDFPGARFSKVGGPHWTLPLNMTVCRGLRAKFGKQLRVGSRLADWARGAIEREERMAALGKAHDAELSRVPGISPVLAAAMSSRTYQRVGARFAAEGRATLIAAEPGLGKTLMAIGAVIEAEVPGPYLVVCPKTAVEAVWARELPRWWPDVDVVTVPDGRAIRDEILDEFAEAAAAQSGDTVAKAYHDFHAAHSWLVVHPEMMRVKRWWVCPVCQDRTPWKAGKKSLNCVSEMAHAAPNSSDVRMEREPNFPQLFEVPWGAVIMDESDRMLIRRNASQTQARNGAEDILQVMNPNGLRIAMSGTPFRGKPQLLWGTLNWLRPKDYSNQWRWTEQYWHTHSTWGGGREIGAIKEEKEPDLYRDLQQVMLRQTKAEVAPDMPAKTYVGTPLTLAESARLDLKGKSAPDKVREMGVAERDLVGVWLPMEPAQEKLYRQMEAEGIASLDGGEVNTIGILAELTRLKQFATAAGRVASDGTFVPALPSNKFSKLLADLEEMGFPDDPQDKVVVVSQFTQVLEMFATEIRSSMDKDWIKARGGSDMACMLTGRVTGQARATTIERFNEPAGSDSPHLMFLNVKAGGVAITLDSADHMVILDETWVVDDQTQVEDRIHRVSRPRPVFYHYYRSLGTVEEHIAEANLEQALESHQVLDGRRGLEFARRVVSKL